MTAAACKLPVTIHYTTSKIRTRIDLERYVLHRSSYIMMYESTVVTQSVAYPFMGQLQTLDSVQATTGQATELNTAI